MSFSLSATFAGVAGSLHAINYEHIGFESVSLAQSGMVLFMAYIGGIGSFLGPILGAISLTYLDTVLSDVTEAWVLYYGIIFVLVIAFAPQGLAGLILMHAPIVRLQPSLFKELVFPYIVFGFSALLLTVGFTSLIELMHSIKSTHSELVIYWIKVSNINFFTWLVPVIFTLLGIYACRRSYLYTKEVWDAIIEKIKFSLEK
tara:strand:- start:59 stop:664 length:606 start_codon:yes stop_codon:yes gene_type:complete